MHLQVLNGEIHFYKSFLLIVIWYTALQEKANVKKKIQKRYIYIAFVFGEQPIKTILQKKNVGDD